MFLNINNLNKKIEYKKSKVINLHPLSATKFINFLFLFNLLLIIDPLDISII